jgi:hypothetical protein
MADCMATSVASRTSLPFLLWFLPDHPQQTIYFAGDFLPDGFSGLFSAPSCLFQRTQLADSFVDGNQFLTEFLKTMEICHFPLPLP